MKKSNIAEIQPVEEVVIPVITEQDIPALMEGINQQDMMSNVSLLPKQVELGNIYKAIIANEPYTIGDYKLATIQEDILKWNHIRNNIGYDANSEFDMYFSEDEEESLGYEEENLHEIIDARCDKFVVMTGTLAKSGLAQKELTLELLEFYDEYKSIPKKIKELGYCFRKCMAECLKEINSREQDLTQAEDWAKNGANGKWLKNVNQNPDTLYKADYTECLDCKDCGN